MSLSRMQPQVRLAISTARRPAFNDSSTISRSRLELSTARMVVRGSSLAWRRSRASLKYFMRSGFLAHRAIRLYTVIGDMRSPPNRGFLPAARQRKTVEGTGWGDFQMMRIALALAAAMSLGGQARAVETVHHSTPELVRACRAVDMPRPDDTEAISAATHDMAACTNFLWGYVAGAGRSQQQLICFPNGGMTGTQLAAVFLQWANANPQSWNESPEDTVFTAFAKAWPCQVTTGATK